MRRKKRLRGRKVDGILLLDKPAGISSNQALQAVKKIFNAQKAGHTGSLDPIATGMLPICFGEATKVSGYLLDSDKRYVFTAKLGRTTTTGDIEGELLEDKPVPELTEKQIRKILDNFIGEIEQIPPMYSALRHEGKRLYELAREGVEIERKPRLVRIYELELLNITADELKIAVHCSKGTYVRTLVEDLGKELGCGAHVSELRRTSVSPFDQGQIMVTLETLRKFEAERETGRFEQLDSLILPIDSALAHCPDVHLTADSAYYLGQGQSVVVPHAPTSGLVRLYEAEDRFLGLGQVQDDGKVAPKRLFFID